MSITGRRAAHQQTYAMEESYELCLKKAKRIHRFAEEFYLYKVDGWWTSISYAPRELTHSTEHWIFKNKRWRKVE